MRKPKGPSQAEVETIQLMEKAQAQLTYNGEIRFIQGKPLLYPDVVPDLPIYSPLNLERARKKIYLTQVQMAGHLRVEVATYRSWEAGRRNMPHIAWAYFWVQWHLIREKLKKKYPLLKHMDGRL